MQADNAVSPQPWHSLFDRLIGEWGSQRGSGPDRTEVLLPASVYTDPARYGLELDRLFRRMPLCIGPVDQLGAPGSVLAREILGLPLLLTRDPDGTVRVLLNACRHRGARVVTEDDVVCRRSSLSCLYHGWTYGLDGKLVSVPRRDAFPTLDIARYGLKQLRSTTRHGLIWVLLDRTGTEMPDIASHLGALDADLSALSVSEFRFFRQKSTSCKANWKIIIDAFVEFYHIKRLHAATIGQFFADSKAVADYVGPHQRLLVARDTFDDVLQLKPEQWSPQTHGTLVHLVFPNCLIVYHPDYISHMALVPAGIDQSVFTHSVLTPEIPRSEKAREHWERSFDLIDSKVFKDEDLFICEQIQKGLAAGASDGFPLGRLEENLRRFHETIDAGLADIDD
jgi:Rieske 2Fe-2S family protein